MGKCIIISCAVSLFFLGGGGGTKPKNVKLAKFIICIFELF